MSTTINSNRNQLTSNKYNYQIISASFCILVFVLALFANLSYAQSSQSRLSIDFDSKGISSKELSKIVYENSLIVKIAELDREVQSIWGDDQFYQMFPGLYLNLRYYDKISPSELDISRYRMAFEFDHWDPFSAYVRWKANDTVLKLKDYNTLNTANKHLHHVFSLILSLKTEKKLQKYTDELIAQWSRRLKILKAKKEVGALNELEEKVSKNSMTFLQNENQQRRTRLSNLRSHLIETLKLSKKQIITINPDRISADILSLFSPSLFSNDNVRYDNFVVNVDNAKIKLQEWMVLGAKWQYLPTFALGVEPRANFDDISDPIGSFDSGHYVYFFEIKFKIWDWFSRSRNVSRQKALLERVKIESQLNQRNHRDQWRNDYKAQYHKLENLCLHANNQYLLKKIALQKHVASQQPLNDHHFRTNQLMVETLNAQKNHEQATLALEMHKLKVLEYCGLLVKSLLADQGLKDATVDD